MKNHGTTEKNTNTYRNTIHGLAHKRPPQQDNNSITFKDNTHINPKDIASAFNKQFINTIPHKTSTTNRKTTRKVRRLQPTQINITTYQVQTARTTTQQDPTTPTTSKTLAKRTTVPHEHIQRCNQRQQYTSCLETGQHHTDP